MPARVPFWTAFFLALATAAAAADPPTIRTAGGLGSGWVLDPLLLRGAVGRGDRELLHASVESISRRRSGGAEMQGVSHADEIDELSSLLEDALGAAPAFGVQIYFAKDDRGVVARWPDPAGRGYFELSGRFEKSLIDDGAGTGLALSLWARKIVGGAAPPEAMVAQYVGNGAKLEIKRRQRAVAGEAQLAQSLDAIRRSGPDPGWLSDALANLPEELPASTRDGIVVNSPEAAYFASTEKTLPCEGADLSALFPDPVSRNQGDVGSCHIFATLAPLEAALYRMYGLHLRLSEADLFVRSKVRSEEFWESGWTDEGGLTSKDLAFAKKHGVALARSASYDAMEPKYAALRERTQRRIEQVIAMPDAGSLDGYDAAREAATGRESKQLLGAPSRELDAQRSAVKRALAPVRLEHADYEPLAAGIKQRDDIVRYLCGGLPVAVGMNLAGLPEWGERGSTRDAEHAFIIKGFRRTLENGLVFTTRNSWGDSADTIPTPNPDIPEWLLSRVDEVDAAVPPPSIVRDPLLAGTLRALAEPR